MAPAITGGQMNINYVVLNGFRHFNHARINFSENTLVIGGNDVGKSNLMHQLYSR